MKGRKTLIILVHAFIGWGLCAATMGIGTALTTIDNTLIIHAVAAPIIFSVVSVVYFKYSNFTSPLQTALIFVAFVMVVDFFGVALLINRSLEMFTSLLGTWIPLSLIITSTLLMGWWVTWKSPAVRGIART